MIRKQSTCAGGSTVRLFWRELAASAILVLALVACTSVAPTADGFIALESGKFT